MTILKRTGAALLCLILTVCMMWVPAGADETAAPTADTAPSGNAGQPAETDSMEISSKTYSLHMGETQGDIEQSPDSPAFWEYPVLRAGEMMQPGTLTVRNDSELSATMILSPVALPYGDEAGLSYLDALWLTVSEGDEVLYHNTYAHINDEDGGFTLRYPDMAPGEEHTYTIQLRCLFTYAGDPYADAVVMPWTFTAQRQTTVMETPQGIPPWMTVALIAAAAVIAVTAVIAAVRGFLRRRRKSA